ncbi:haloacid dehalogenase [Pullulanibacillus camelliae]|uniref:Haloacid dehalogenase n=1 Tax=Pullulanibacillus camelliae TaxID=1707096 RepID=A0A8J2VJS5_9BACL|nr:HAD family hydrolase [Pullulanibacillus camelliae]GGE28047.1 haloacid dehalogenase [Pullulanibacillus camelliae]
MIFFDLDDTLHDHLRPFAQAIECVFPDLSETFSSIEEVYKGFRAASDLLWKQYDANELSLGELRIQRIIIALKAFKSNINREQAVQFQNRYEVQSTNLKLFPEVPKLLTDLKQKGYLLGILSNGPTTHQLNKIKALELDRFVPRNFIFISNAVGIAKPDPHIFNLVSRKVNCLPEEILYIGDTWENDVVASIEGGWQAIWFNHRRREPGSEHQPFAVVESLSEIVDLLY